MPLWTPPARSARKSATVITDHRDRRRDRQPRPQPQIGVGCAEQELWHPEENPGRHRTSASLRPGDRAQVEQLRGQLAAARRAGFRRRPLRQGPTARTGRRPGRWYAVWSEARPRPARGGSAGADGVMRRVGRPGVSEEIPEVRPVVRRFDIEVGRCSQCRRRVQGRHALQTSDALGAAGAQLGPGVVALVVELHTAPLAKVAHVLRTTFGLHGTGRPRPPAAPHGPRRRADLLCEQVRNSPTVAGWRVGAIWLSFDGDRSTPFAPAASSTMPPRFKKPTSPGCSCATGGCRIAATENAAPILSESPGSDDARNCRKIIRTVSGPGRCKRSCRRALPCVTAAPPAS